MPLEDFEVIPSVRPNVKLNIKISEDLNTRDHSLVEFLKIFDIEHIEPIIVSKAIKLNITITLVGDVRVKVKKVVKPKVKSRKPSKGSLVSSNEEDEEFTRRFSVRSERLLDIPPSVFFNNRVKFLEEIRRKMLEIKFKKDNSTCDRSETKDFTPLVHQLIVQRYINSYTPYRGLLLYHGLGSGKTCSSISIIEGMKNTHKIFIMTPASLQANYRTQMKYCGEQIFKKNNHWIFEKINDFSGPKFQAFLDNVEINDEYLRENPELLKFVKQNRGIWKVDTTRQPNFNELSPEEQEVVEQQINILIELKYSFINYNGITKTKWLQLSTRHNPFDNSVIIIDEVHNFVSRIMNKIRVKRESVSTKMYEAIMDAENCKVIPLSGTPFINYPCELGTLFNLIAGYTYALEVIVNIKNSKVNDAYFKKLLSQPYIDIVQYETSYFKLRIVQNPYGFIKEETGKMLYDGNTMSRSLFVDTVLKILKDEGAMFTVSKYELVKYKKLPDEEKEFNKFFVTADNKINNKEWFQSKIIGMVSYLGDKSELMPEIVKTESGSDIHIVDSFMSPHQLSVYSIIRNEEREKDRVSKKQKDEDTFSSTYRVFSRACCNFAFPTDEHKRPMPKSKNVTEDDLDVVDNESLVEDIDGKYDESDIEGRRIETTYEKEIQDALEYFKRNPSEYFNSEIKKLVPTKEPITQTLKIYSPKFYNVLKNIMTPENIGCNLLYSNFRKLEGVGIFSIILKYYGFLELKIVKHSDKSFHIDLEGLYDKKLYKGPKKVFALYTGTETHEEKEIIRNIYNSEYDDLPNTIQQELALNFPEIKDKNLHGGIIKLLMITASGAEGIDLKNTRFVHIMEPYWHHVRMNQVIGRARRICSHANLPEDERDVTVFLYVSKFSKDTDMEEYKQIQTLDGSKTTDESLYGIMERKRGLSVMFLDTLKEASIDCIVNYKSKCVQFPFSKLPDGLLSGIDYTKDPTTKFEVDKEKHEIRKRTLKVNGEDVVFAIDITSKPPILYDYDQYISEEHQLVKLGTLEEGGVVLL
jgi:hypothetical protein